MDEGKIKLPCNGGPWEGRVEDVPEAEVRAGAVLLLVPAERDGEDPKGRYEVSRIRGYWSLEWVPAGTPTTAEVWASAGIGTDEKVVREPIDVPGQPPAPPYRPPWNVYLRDHGVMPPDCPQAGYDHSWGPWGAPVTATGPEKSRTCSTCGKTEFSLVEHGGFGTVEEALTADETEEALEEGP
jgi:hypothetical protein